MCNISTKKRLSLAELRAESKARKTESKYKFNTLWSVYRKRITKK